MPNELPEVAGAAIDGLILDRAGFARRCEHYLRWSGEHGRPVSFRLNAPSASGGLASAELIADGSGSGPPLRAYSPEHFPAGHHPVLSREAAAFLDQLNDAILITDANPVGPPGPVVLYCNRAFTQVTGYAAEDIVGKTPRILQGKGTQSDALERLSVGLRRWEAFRVELTNYRKDGSPFQVEIDIVPVSDETGWPSHYVSVQRDVSARVREQNLLLQANRTEVAGAFARGVVHELNNHLTVMMVLLEELASEHAGSESLGLLEERVQLIGEVVKHLRLWSVRKEDRSARAFLLELDRALAALPEEPRHLVTVEERAVPEDARVRIAAPQLVDILMNLFLNTDSAVRERGGRRGLRLSARVSQWRGERAVSLFVADSGPGLPPALGEKVFLPHVSTRDSSGLGLFTVAQLVANAGGAVRVVENPLGERGATFELVLPIVAAEP